MFRAVFQEECAIILSHGGVMLTSPMSDGAAHEQPQCSTVSCGKATNVSSSESIALLVHMIGVYLSELVVKPEYFWEMFLIA